MGSLSASGIPVVTKRPLSYRQYGRRLKSTDNRNDTVVVIDAANTPAPLTRVISSGSIIRDDGSVEYYEDLVYGVYRMGRSARARIASETGIARDDYVELAGNVTQAIIPTGLSVTITQKGAVHTGERVVVRDSRGLDLLVERISNSGAFD